MIRPIRSGRALLDEIELSSPSGGTVHVWWLGQSGYVIKGRSGLVVVDPYLSEHLTHKYARTARPHIRMTEAPFRGNEFPYADFVLASHKHSDHLDPGTVPDLLEASPRARLLLPAALIDHALAMGLPARRLDGLDAGSTRELADGLRLKAIASAHEGLDTDEFGRHLYLGFILEIDGVRIYHSGDTLVYPGLAERLAEESLDVAFLPINGRDPARGVAGNMNAAEAVDLANSIRPRFVVPHHYDMFTFNTVPISDFTGEAGRLASGISPHVLRCGERWEVGPWA